jgi:hypothetical protein
VAEFRKLLARVDKTIPVGLDIHLICDKLRHPQHPGNQGLAGPPPRLPPAFSLRPDLPG